MTWQSELATAVTSIYIILDLRFAMQKNEVPCIFVTGLEINKMTAVPIHNNGSPFDIILSQIREGGLVV